MSIGAGGREQALHHQRVNDVAHVTRPIFFFHVGRRELEASCQHNRSRVNDDVFGRLGEVNRINRADLFAFAAKQAVVDVDHGFLGHGGRKRYSYRADGTQIAIKSGVQINRAGILTLATARA